MATSLSAAQDGAAGDSAGRPADALAQVLGPGRIRQLGAVALPSCGAAPPFRRPGVMVNTALEAHSAILGGPDPI
jgi:hypothetical protein